VLDSEFIVARKGRRWNATPPPDLIDYGYSEQPPNHFRRQNGDERHYRKRGDIQERAAIAETRRMDAESEINNRTVQRTGMLYGAVQDGKALQQARKKAKRQAHRRSKMKQLALRAKEARISCSAIRNGQIPPNMLQPANIEVSYDGTKLENGRKRSKCLTKPSRTPKSRRKSDNKPAAWCGGAESTQNSTYLLNTTLWNGKRR